MAARYSLTQITEIPERKVFFDANVLIYLFWPTGTYEWESYYSSAFASLYRQKNELCVDFLVISEIINRTHRIEYSKYLQLNDLSQSDFSYKSYRNSAEGKEALKDIYTVVNDNILNIFKVFGRSFEEDDIRKFLTVDTLDFNDKAILLNCLENDCVLCTNDRDYREAEIDILTSNPALLIH